MAKHHEIKSEIESVTGLTALHCDGGFDVTVLGDQQELVGPTEEALTKCNIPFRKRPKGKAWSGQVFHVPIINCGTAFQADWAFDRN